MTYLHAIILAIIEGITEFLPVSSTGHMVIASSVMGIHEQAFTKIFEVNIQFGAILSVVVLYWQRFFQNIDFYFKLFVAFLPAAFFGVLLGDVIDSLLENVIAVALSLLVGGVILLWVDTWFAKTAHSPDSKVNYTQSFQIGLFQCIALVPGVSRSAASIIGGMAQGLNRRQAAEFSFFLAVPTMLAASGYKLLKDYDKIQSSDIQLLLLGNVVGFVVAMLAIKFFIGFVTQYGFRVFGYYRIALGILLLGLYFAGIPLRV